MSEVQRDSTAFPILTPQEIDQLRPRGVLEMLQDGHALWEPGEREICFYVVIEGAVSIRDNKAATEEIAQHRTGSFTGDVDVMTGRPVPIGAYAFGHATVLKLSAEDIREVVRVEQDLGGKILAAFIRRREMLLSSASHGVMVIGSGLDPETQRVREFLGRNRVVHRWHQPEEPAMQEILSAFELSAEDTPLVFLGNTRLSHPTVAELADKLGTRAKSRLKSYDLVIIGAGPAGLAAAVYGASEGLQTLVLDRTAPGGQASWSSRIENYMGFPEGLTGSDLAARGLIQAQKFGAEISIPSEVLTVTCTEGGHDVQLTNGEVIGARAVIVASGARYQKLQVPGFERFETAGIYYAATALEATFCTDQEVVVVGAGNSAGQAAVYLSTKCKKVTLVVRGDQLNKNMSDYLSYRVEQIPNIEVLLETEVEEVRGGSQVEEVVLKGRGAKTIPCAGLFVFIGATPNTAFLKETLELDRSGFILTGDSMRAYWNEPRIPYYLETSCAGIFAAGDCRVGSVKRVASSVGEGSMAVTFVHRYLAL